jgi:hypothetical protein
MNVTAISAWLCGLRHLFTDVINTGYNGSKDVNLEQDSTRFFQVCQVLGGATPGRPSFMGFIRVSGSVALYAAVIGLDIYWPCSGFSSRTVPRCCRTPPRSWAASPSWIGRPATGRCVRCSCRHWRARPASALSG